MKFRFYNTLSRRVERFEPIEPGQVRMYNCGPTVYDDAHIGNFRSFLMADLLRRTLEMAGLAVVQVMNITDVGHMTEDQLTDGGGEDKMQKAVDRMKAAKKGGQAEVTDPNDPFQVAAYFAQRFLADAKSLRLRIADESDSRMPRATDHIKPMIRLIERLIEKNHAYVSSTGAVYYDVHSFSAYGCLSGNTLDRLREGAGERIEAENQADKRHPADFLLWKPDQTHLMKWPSPWGEGYPGWHIECSAMAMAVHGVETIDIHTGGEDNIFPHHECEIAQSTGASDKPFARHWLHARFLLVEGEKMSKSKGNFYTARQVFEKGVEPAALRFELIRTHYRKNMNFTAKGLEDATKELRRLRAFVDHHPHVTAESTPKGSSEIEQAFLEALADDLNISDALGRLHAWMNRTPNPTAEDVAALRRMDAVLGVLDQDVVAPHSVDGLSDEQIAERCRAIDAARVAKDYATSDRLRDELTAAGVDVQITRDGTHWQRRLSVDL